MNGRCPELAATFFGEDSPLDDPYLLYAELREAGPAFHRPLRAWLISRYDEVAELLHHPAASSAKSRPAIRALRSASSERPFVELGELSMLNRDPPDHTRLRGLVNRAFTPRVVAGLRSHVERIADELIGRSLGRGGFDLVSNFAYPLPLAVIFELMGIPQDDQPFITSLAADLADNHGPLLGGGGRATRRRGKEAWLRASGYFGHLATERRHRPADDLISRMIEASEVDDRLTEEELIANCTLIVAAGHETTANLIANATLALLRHPDQLVRLREEPSVVKSAVEELIRYDTSIQLPRRTALAELQIGGTAIPKGHQLMLLVGSANRDPTRFSDPDRLDLARRDTQHLSFGWGPHYCLGAALARMEIEIAIGRLIQLPQLELAGEAVEWRRSLALRGPRCLPLRWRPPPRS